MCYRFLQALVHFRRTGRVHAHTMGQNYEEGDGEVKP
jgi:hypothetical protein